MDTTELDPDTQRLLAPWPGRHGGLPPLDGVAPAALEAAVRAAIGIKRAEIRRIVDDSAPASFGNTCEAFEDSGRALVRVTTVFQACSNSRSIGEMPGVSLRVAPLLSALEDEIAHDDALFARIDAVWRKRAALAPQQQRLVDVQRHRLLRRGAGLPPPSKAQLALIQARIAALSAEYNQNLIAEAAMQAVFIDDESALDGLPEPLRQAAADAAAEKGRPGAWAIPSTRGAVWPVLTLARDRALRERVWRMWTKRGDPVNAPLAAEMLQLRGDLARLMGHASYAHYALFDRMARTPETVNALLERTWASVRPAAEAQLAEYQAIAAREGLGDRLQPWDRQYYAEKLRRERFGLDGDAVTAHLELGAVLEAMFWAAGRVHGLSFEPIADAPLIDPSVRVYEVRRAGASFGVLYFDLLNRPGKTHGSYQCVYRDAETFRGQVLPVCAINSSFPPPAHGQPVLLPWEYANVFFHEFGHALHMLFNATAYPSLASQRVAWDFVELPALLNERWLRDRELLSRFARHHVTGEPLPDALIDRIEQGLTYDRIFSLNLDYLLPAILDMRLHLMADGSGRAIDPVNVENETATELGMPAAWDVVMRVTHNFHLFVGGHYAAGLYSYLWADVMAADAVAVFERSPGGIYDRATADRWIGEVLSVGHGVDAAGAFRSFAGHDPDPGPLQQRFSLGSIESNVSAQ